MYRASGFLLDKSYKVHRPIIIEILKSKYDKLWDIDILDITKDSRDLRLLFELYCTLKKKYADQINNSKKVTHTLITKVMLGTLCCTPAYDSYFKEGCKKSKIKPYSNFSKPSLIKVIEYYKQHKNEFNSASKK